MVGVEGAIVRVQGVPTAPHMLDRQNDSYCKVQSLAEEGVD